VKSFTWLGADLAGAVAQAFGWRAAFFALGAPGLLLGFLVFLTIREPQRGRLDAIGGEGKPSFIESLRFLWRQKAAFHVIMTFLMRTYSLNVAQAGAVTGHVHLVGGILFLHRTLHGIGVEPRTEQHALDIHRMVRARRKRVQPDRRAAGCRNRERLVCPRPWRRRRIIAPGVVGARADGILGDLAFFW
jgi:hypothetical protein